MTQEQIEAVRARAITVRYSVITFGGHVQTKLHDEIADDLNALITRLSEVERERDEARAEVERGKRDTQRLIWKDEAASVCSSVEMCFEYGDTVRCGPCGIKLAAAAGVEEAPNLPNLPEVSRLNRQLAATQYEVARLRTQREKHFERTTALEAEVARLTKERDEALGTLRWAHETLYEINPSNYDHDEVTTLNDASVEVILGIAPLLGEKHGKTDAWWHSRIEGQRAQLAACQAESAACWKNLVEAGRQRDQARADLATLRAAIAEAVRRADNPSRYAECFSYEVAKFITEPLRNLTKPDTPSERIMSDKDRENPVEGAHPTQPEGEDALVEATKRLLRYEGHMVWCGHGKDDSKPCVCGLLDAQDDARKALASRGLVRGEGVER